MKGILRDDKQRNQTAFNAVPRRNHAQDSGPESFEQENSGGEDGGIAAGLVLRRLRDVAGGDDFAAETIDFFFLVPRFVFVELDSERGGQHGGGQVFRVIARFFFRLAVGMMFAQIAILIFIGGNRQADGSRQLSPRFVGGASRNHGEGDRAGDQQLDALFFGYDLTARREDAGHADQVADRNPRVAQRQFEGPQFLLMEPNAFGKEHFFGDEQHVTSPSLREWD